MTYEDLVASLEKSLDDIWSEEEPVRSFSKLSETWTKKRL